METLQSISKKIGATPIYEIKLNYKNKDLTIYAKAEDRNFSGSVKARMALYIIKSAIEQNILKIGGSICEATSGNTGIALAQIARELGYKTIIFMPETMSYERRQSLIEAGATLNLVSKEEGGLTACVRKAKEYVETHDNTLLADQFNNINNVNANYEGTGEEIVQFAKENDIKKYGFVCGVGTGGTFTGVAKRLKEESNTVINVLEAECSPLLSKNKPAPHKIQGLNGDFQPSILNLGLAEKVQKVNDSECVYLSHILLKNKILSIGFSASANLLSAIKCSYEYDIPFFTVFPDNADKYLSLIEKTIPLEKEYISNDIKNLKIKLL